MYDVFVSCCCKQINFRIQIMYNIFIYSDNIVDIIHDNTTPIDSVGIA